MDYNKMTLFVEEFEEDSSNEVYKGITLLVNGQVKKLFDKLISMDEKYNNYVEVVKEALFIGLDKMIQDVGNFNSIEK